MQYVQANIGRNIKGTSDPMALSLWNKFVTDVAGAITEAAISATFGEDGLSHPDDNIEIHRGMGTYGNVEESAHISLVYRAIDVEWLRDRLRELAKTYSQDCIALITSSELVFSS